MFLSLFDIQPLKIYIEEPKSGSKISHESGFSVDPLIDYRSPPNTLIYPGSLYLIPRRYYEATAPRDRNVLTRGSVEIPLQAKYKIVPRLIHGRLRVASWVVSLHELRDIAVVTGYAQRHETVDMAPKMRVQATMPLFSNLPPTRDRPHFADLYREYPTGKISSFLSFQ